MALPPNSIVPAPHIITNPSLRPYGINREAKECIQLWGPTWMKLCSGVVIYENKDVSLERGRYHLGPRNATMRHFPGNWPPPVSFTRAFAPGVWTPIDWIQPPNEPGKDPEIQNVQALRRAIWALERDYHGHWVANDIWSQSSNRAWPWADEARLPE